MGGAYFRRGRISGTLRYIPSEGIYYLCFYLLEAVKNWMMGRLENDATPNQAYSNLLPRQIVILQLYRHKARSAAIHIVCMPKPL